MNRTAAVRDYIAANPGSSSRKVSAALGIPHEPVRKACSHMIKSGMISVTESERIYSPGRPIIRQRYLTTEQRAERGRKVLAGQLARRKVRRAEIKAAPESRFKGSVVRGSATDVAIAIASAAGDGQIFAYRFDTGSYTWRKSEGTLKDAELIGCYNPGCDWRQIAEDLAA